MNVLVTGASGGYGHYALEYLQKITKKDNLYALVRSEAKGAALKAKGINVRIGDFSDLESMKKALKGIDRLLFVSVSIPNIQKNVVDAAVFNNVKYIAYTSILDPQYSKFGLEINHSQTEQWIKDSGIAHTFLRNGWYLEIAQSLIDYAKKTKQFLYFADKGKTTFALKSEYAKIGAKVIVNGSDQEILDLARTPITYQELGLATQKALGEKLDIKKVSADEFVSKLNGAGVNQQFTMISKSYQDYTIKGNNGEDQASQSTFDELNGQPLPDLSEAIKKLL
ncbi:SDR family oxidoreductase [Companilactobacillus alimentarius]|uniref:Isoflavone reductase n=1 Tax=Companilactobacillus alimentarius DSM 20249 TaxID=1423720 RepID=A0A2K9HMF1_9LACO|nr:NAD(P)H-binding protein [Companilactobacillus alimentarius]AUI71183.1 isoflavone reductase [Companilactobacillus alimentarius DSM 20249]KRK75315.1 YtfG protein [Companilactobacillus alimentarius DSM 20249]MDT6951544.1 NAD(P)H-binding protein [Companilactobacillus alimentarius]GEO43902.1 NAD(P)-dependent oxidoreductase [Companilactobacillus alimentarius]